MSDLDTPAKRIQRYLDMRALKPMKQLGDCIHAVNGGSEFEGELWLSDLISLKAKYDELERSK